LLCRIQQQQERGSAALRCDVAAYTLPSYSAALVPTAAAAAAAAAACCFRWCPEEGANWLSQLFFAYANSLVRLGGRKHLEQADLWDTAHRQAQSSIV
jgi:hypothetical protein